MPTLTVTGGWESIFRGRAKATLEAILPDFLRARRWFGGKARTIQSAKILEAITVPHEPPGASIILVRVEYTEGTPETYILPLTFASGGRAAQVQDEFPHAVVARLRVRGEDEEGVLYDALWEKSFSMGLLEAIAHHRRFKGALGELIASQTRAFRQLLSTVEAPMEPSVMRAEQSNTSVVYGDRFILKLFRRLEAGVNPDLEIGRFLTERGFAHIPPVAGALEYRGRNGKLVTLAILQGFVPNQGDAWQYTLDALGRYFEGILAWQAEVQTTPVPCQPLLAMIEDDIPLLASELIGLYLEVAKLLGQRTAELHVALASDPDDPNFTPEPFSDSYRLAFYHAMLGLADQALQLLRQSLKALPEVLQRDAKKVLDLERKVRQCFQPIRDQKITAMRVRSHGDYHLGQVLYTGKDFVIIDFEGEPARSLDERRLKRSPLQDVAGMLRSFHYAAYAALFNQAARGMIHPTTLTPLEGWAQFWYLWVSAVFLKAYFEIANQASFLSRSREELQVLLEVYLLEKAIYELGYELNNRPDWVKIPLQGILQLLETTS